METSARPIAALAVLRFLTAVRASSSAQSFLRFLHHAASSSTASISSGPCGEDAWRRRSGNRQQDCHSISVVKMAVEPTRRISGLVAAGGVVADNVERGPPRFINPSLSPNQVHTMVSSVLSSFICGFSISVTDQRSVNRRPNDHLVDQIMTSVRFSWDYFSTAVCRLFVVSVDDGVVFGGRDQGPEQQLVRTRRSLLVIGSSST